MRHPSTSSFSRLGLLWAHPLNITRQPAQVRHLSECKWWPSTSSVSMKYYGRDVDVTLTCWIESYPVMEDP